MEELMSFSDALELLKKGKRIARAGWNGRGMFVYLNKGSFERERVFDLDEGVYPVDRSTIDGISLGLFEPGDRGTLTRLPNINMRTVSGTLVTGWLASQADLLADDWMVVPDDIG